MAYRREAGKSNGVTGKTEVRDLAAFRDAACLTVDRGEHISLQPSTVPRGVGEREKQRNLGVGAGNYASKAGKEAEETVGVAWARVTFLVPSPNRPVSRGEVWGRGPSCGEAWWKRLCAETYLGPVAAQMQRSMPPSLQPSRKKGCGTTHLREPLRQGTNGLQLQTRQ